MTEYDHDRRTFLKSAGGILSITAVAGCLSGNDDEPQPEDRNDDGGVSDDEYDFDGWLDDAAGYDGVHDYTGESEVTVRNGAGSSGMEYDPVAIVVDPGTTVVWEWTGDGGVHTVTEDDGLFDSGLESEEGVTFEYTFEEDGIYRYYCEPHVNVGQKGAVVVE